MLFRKLRADEIDVRIGSTKSDKGTTLLLYKDARCDMNILDETVGALNWKRHHTRDNANCIVSIWNDDIKEWVSKEDTGTESFTEQEKGLASDSFKRACFNWGIGRELYTAGLIFIPNSVIEKEKIKYKRFEVSLVTYDKQGNIDQLEIICDGKVVFTKGNKRSSTTTQEKAPQYIGDKKITLKQEKAIKDIYLGQEDKLQSYIEKTYSVQHLSQLRFDQAEKFIEMLNKAYVKTN